LDLQLVLVGEGSETRRLQQISANLGLQERVRLETFTHSPWLVYPALDVFLMPSRTEGLPLGLLEAMACGCCPIAMGVGGVPDVITSPELGWLVNPEDRAGFYRAMQAAARSNASELSAMGRRARAHIVSHFDERAQYLKFAEQIEEEFVGCKRVRHTPRRSN
jgi:glycosyltransferase involved in cell wall biosynthesis